jgi:hypothetical protein
MHALTTRERLETTVAATTGVVLCALAAFVTWSGSPSDSAWLEAAARALLVGAPIAVGIYARRLPPFRRFGGLLIAAGGFWFLTTLANSTDEVLYSVGRVAGWWGDVVLVFLVLTFPSGHLRGRVDRALAGGLALVFLILCLPSALLVAQYPMPSPYTTCDPCPPNAFMVVGSEPAFVENVVRPVRELLSVAIFVVVTVRFGVRIRGSSHLVRRTLTPVLTIAVFSVTVLAVALSVRRSSADADLVLVLSWLVALAVPAMAVAFLVGLARWRLFVAGAQQRLASRLRGHPGPEDLRRALADAFDDPTLDIAYWIGAGHGR